MKKLTFSELYRNLKNIIVNLLGVIVIFLLQYALIASFASMGLVDPAPLEISLGGNLPSISISILFHLIPLNVVFILLSSWIYLNKLISGKPKTFRPIKRGGETKSLTGKFHFLESIPKGILGVIALFSFLLFIIFMLVYPSALYNFTLNLYQSNYFFRAFIKWSSQVNSSLINAVGLFAASFRSSLSGLIKPLSEPLIKADITWKYLICQNVTAWLTVIFALAYGKYHEKGRRRWR